LLKVSRLSAAVGKGKERLKRNGRVGTLISQVIGQEI
jgi:hypothetical protein